MNIKDFLGSWSINRRIDDRQWGDETACLHATACISAPRMRGDTDWDYYEHGQLTLPSGDTFMSERAYIWRVHGTDIDVHFCDGRFFHTIPLQSGTATHWCSPDDYKVAYDFSNWPQWRTTWDVNGPKKCYTMVSVYHKLPNEALHTQGN